MNHTIIDGKPYVVGEARLHWEGGIDGMLVVEVFDGEKFVPGQSADAIDVHNKVLRDIYRRLDALESKVK